MGWAVGTSGSVGSVRVEIVAILNLNTLREGDKIEDRSVDRRGPSFDGYGLVVILKQYNYDNKKWS